LIVTGQGGIMELGTRRIVWYGSTVAMMIVICCGYGLYRVIHRSHRIVCIFDNQLSASAQTEINEYIQNNALAFDSLDVQSKFLCLDSLHLRVLNTTTCVVQCVSCQPLVKIQDDKVVTSSGRIVSQKLFAVSALNECGTVLVGSEVLERTTLFPFEVESLCTVAGNSDDQFQFIWHKPTEIYCFDKKDPYFVVLIKDSFCDEMKEDYLRIKGMQKGLQRGKFAHCVDMRFAHQHVFRQMDRGSYEEKIVC
jgi:hypothetical protein